MSPFGFDVIVRILIIADSYRLLAVSYFSNSSIWGDFSISS
jgi:hypothetical protein